MRLAVLFLLPGKCVSETVIVNRRDLLLALSSTPLGQGKEKDAALKRLQLAAVYEPAKPDTVVARFHTRTDTLERDERIARLSRERLTDTEIMIREGVTKNTVTAARKRIMARQNMDGIREAFLGDLEAV